MPLKNTILQLSAPYTDPEPLSVQIYAA